MDWIMSKENQASITPFDAMDLLIKGNKRFVNNLMVNRDLLQLTNLTSKGQWPFATVLSCIDSRTSAELIFDQGLGDIFSIRVAGNIVNTDILGSMEFACKMAGSKLIVVMGHTNCGAIKGACDHLEMGNLTDLLAKVHLAMEGEGSRLEHKLRNSSNVAFVQSVSELNVRYSVDFILDRSPILRDMVKNGEIVIIGAMYSLETGRVDFYQDSLRFSPEAFLDHLGRTK